MQIQLCNLSAIKQLSQLSVVLAVLSLTACAVKPERAVSGSAVIPQHVLAVQNETSDAEQAASLSNPDRCAKAQPSDEYYYLCVDRTRDGESATQKGKAVIKWKTDN